MPSSAATRSRVDEGAVSTGLLGDPEARGGAVLVSAARKRDIDGGPAAKRSKPIGKTEDADTCEKPYIARAITAEQRLKRMERGKAEAIARAESAANQAAIHIRRAKKIAKREEEELKRVEGLVRRVKEAEERARVAEEALLAAKARTEAAERRNSELIRALNYANERRNALPELRSNQDIFATLMQKTRLQVLESLDVVVAAESRAARGLHSREWEAG